MGNPITNNLPAKLDQFLMDMAQTVGPFDYSDIMHFADRISDVKKDKNIAILRKLYSAAKDAAEYDDDEELSIIGEDINDIVTGVKDFNQPGAIFADTRTFKYEDSQNSEYNDLGTDIRTGEDFPDRDESLYESRKRVKESIQAYTGNTIVMQLAIENYFKDFNLDIEIEDYTFGNGWNTIWTFECAGEDFKYIDDEVLKSYILERDDFRDVELDVFSYRNKIEVEVVDSEDDEDDEDDIEPSKFLGTDTRTGEKFPESLNESEDVLTDMQKDLIKEIALADFECGHFTDVSFFIDDEEDDFTGVEQAAADYYTELINMGPAGFYEEFRDELDFDPDFVAEYGDPEDEDDLDESTKKSDLKEDLDLDSLVGKKVKCIKGASHPNMGKLFTKGKTYTVDKTEDGRFTVGKVCVGEDFFKNHFEVENALDENYDDIYSATFKAKGFVNQMRKTYDDATIIQAVEICLKGSKK